MHKTPIVSLIFTFLFSLFFTWAAFAALHLPIRLWRLCLFAAGKCKCKEANANAKWLYTLYLAAKRWILM